MFFAITFQVFLGYLTNQGQGSIGMIVFAILVELDPSFSFRYIKKNIQSKKEGINNGKN